MQSKELSIVEELDEALRERPALAYGMASDSKYLAERLVENPSFSAKDMMEHLQNLRDKASLLEVAKNRGLLTFFPAPDQSHKVLPNDLYMGLFLKRTPPGWLPGVDLNRDPAWQRRVIKGREEIAEIVRIGPDKIRRLEEEWRKLAAMIRGFNILKWMASNFPVLDSMVVQAFEEGYNLHRPTAMWFYKTYKDKFDWREVQRRLYTHSTPFYESMLADRARDAKWLSTVFDVTGNVKGAEGRRLFKWLFALNNLAAVEWLFDEYDPPLDALFDPKKDDPSALVALMERYGRPELARLLSRRYGIVPAETISEVLMENSVLALPPPPSTNIFSTPPEWRDRLWFQGISGNL